MKSAKTIHLTILAALSALIVACEEEPSRPTYKDNDSDLSFCDAIKEYDRLGRRLEKWNGVDHNDDRGPSKHLFKLHEGDPLPSGVFEEMLSEADVLADVTGIISIYSPFKHIKDSDIVEYQRWFRDCNNEQMRGIYFKLKNGDRYLLIRGYAGQTD